MLRPTMTDLHVALSTAYGAQPQQRYDLFLPHGGEHFALTVCFHGGWFNAGRHEELRGFALALAEHGLPSACIGLRPLVSAAHPDGARHGQDLIDEAKTALQKALADAGLHGFSSNSAVLLGSGSGSLIALDLANHLHAERTLRLRGVVACGVTPSLDHGDGNAPERAKILDQFAGANRHGLSPVHVRPETLPPLLLLHGDADHDVPAKLAQRLHQRAIDAGEPSSLAILAGLGHQFIEQPSERGGRAALERVLPWLDEHAREPDALALFAGR